MKNMNLYEHCLILSKPSRMFCGSSGKHWIKHPLFREDFTEDNYNIYYSDEHLLNSSKVIDLFPSLNGHILSFKNKNDAIKFKLASSKYINIKNIIITYKHITNDIVTDITNLMMKHKEYKSKCNELREFRIAMEV